MELETNVVYCGDCLKQLEKIPDESIDLIYIDPPFSSNRNYVAFWQEQEKRHFEDRFENVRAYIDYMKPRLKELHRVLKATGSFYYHCDWHASHYIKMLLDSDGNIYSTDILHIVAGAGILALRENRDAKVVDIAMSDEVIEKFPGPAYGASGLRKLTGFSDRIAFGTILKLT